MKKSDLENILILPRSMTIQCIKESTHLVITAPPEKNKCPILSKYEKVISHKKIGINLLNKRLQQTK